jgi:hypothetical protein
MKKGWALLICTILGAILGDVTTSTAADAVAADTAYALYVDRLQKGRSAETPAPEGGVAPAPASRQIDRI